MAHDPTLLTAGLLADGFVIIPDLVAPALVATIDAELTPHFAVTPFCQGGFYGARTKRFGALLRRSAQAHALIAHPLVLRIAETVLGQYCDRIALSLAQAVELHPQALAQIPHRDQDIYGGAKGAIEYQINIIWPLTLFTAANGATLIWPNSHGRCSLSDAELPAPLAAEMPPGSALMWLGSTLHGGGANMTDAPRRAARWALMLRVHDAQAAGASQREIASTLFGVDAVADWKTGSASYRSRVRRLADGARQLARTDPRGWLNGELP